MIVQIYKAKGVIRVTAKWFSILQSGSPFCKKIKKKPVNIWMAVDYIELFWIPGGIMMQNNIFFQEEELFDGNLDFFSSTLSLF